MPRPSNKARSAERTKCREALAEHIWGKTGIRVDKVHLRLNPRPQDTYYWRILDESNEQVLRFFQTGPNQIPLSGLPKSVHQILQQHVGITFEAIPKAKLRSVEEPSLDTQNDKKHAPSELNLRETIARLETEKIRIEEENSQLLTRMESMKCENLQKEESITQERLNWEAERTDLREQIDQWKLETNLVQIKIENLQKAIMEAYDALCNVNTYLVS